MNATDYSWTYKGGDPAKHEQHGYEGTLEEAIVAARDCACDIELHDEPGFVRGWVHADGNWRLS